MAPLHGKYAPAKHPKARVAFFVCIVTAGQGVVDVARVRTCARREKGCSASLCTECCNEWSLREQRGKHRQTEIVGRSRFIVEMLYSNNTGRKFPSPPGRGYASMCARSNIGVCPDVFVCEILTSKAPCCCRTLWRLCEGCKHATRSSLCACLRCVGCVPRTMSSDCKMYVCVPANTHASAYTCGRLTRMCMLA
jgi:hypothetical protein